MTRTRGEGTLGRCPACGGLETEDHRECGIADGDDSTQDAVAPNAAISDAISVLTDCAQFMDAVRADAIQEGWWSEWDQQVRNRLSATLVALYALPNTLTCAPAPSSGASRTETAHSWTIGDPRARWICRHCGKEEFGDTVPTYGCTRGQSNG